MRRGRGTAAPAEAAWAAPTARGPWAAARRLARAAMHTAAGRAEARRRGPVAAHTAAARPAAARRLAQVAAHTAAARPAADRRHRGAGERRLEPRESPDPLWHRMDSCPPARRSALGPRRRPRCLDRPEAGARSKPAGRGLRNQGGQRAARAAPVGARTEAERAAVPRLARVAVRGLGAGARPAEHRPVEALPRRPMGSRKRGRICWRAGSSRRTACTHSCENSRARAMRR